MEKVQPNEIRIELRGGLLQCVGLGKDVPTNLRITLTDYDIEGRDPTENPRIQETGYGNMAYCRVLDDPELDAPDADVDEEGVRWV